MSGLKNMVFFVALFVIFFTCLSAEATVTVDDDGTNVTLSNGIVTVVFDKTTHFMTSLSKQGGPDLLSSGKGYFDADTDLGHAAMASGGNMVYQEVANTSSYAEISFSQAYSSRIPFNVELHYIITEGASGVYWYATYSTDGEPEKELGQTRLVLRADPVLSNYRLTDDRYGSLAEPGMVYDYSADMADGVYDGVSPNGAERLTPGEASQLADGSIDYKYLTHNREDQSPVYGLYGSYSQDYWGIWMVTPSYESINGGHSKQNLAVHQSTSTPVLLRMLQAGHYGGDTLDFADGETWSKFYGPFFIYVNSSDNSETLWSQAKAQAAAEQQAFPYSWVDNPLFPTRRANVTGTLNITDGSIPTNAWIGLVDIDGDNRYWGQSGKGYQYWGQVQSDGSFTIENVRGGIYYKLYAHSDGVMGEYVEEDVIIAPRGSSLGTIEWTPKKYGKTIWQLGDANRSVAEYKRGDDLSHWGLWLDYPIDFPDGVNYVIGQSDPAQDWNYAHCTVGWTVPYRETPISAFTVPDWNILFDMERVSNFATAYLRIAIVSCSLYDENSEFAILVNGAEVGRYDGTELGVGGAMARTAHYGYSSYLEKVVSFDSSLLETGTNTITFGFNGDRLDAIMYDCIRLEIDYKADINEDGVVDIEDFAILSADWLL